MKRVVYWTLLEEQKTEDVCLSPFRKPMTTARVLFLRGPVWPVPGFPGVNAPSTWLPKARTDHGGSRRRGAWTAEGDPKRVA